MRWLVDVILIVILRESFLLLLFFLLLLSFKRTVKNSGNEPRQELLFDFSDICHRAQVDGALP